MAERSSFTVLAILVVVVLVAAGIAAGVVYFLERPKSPAAPQVVDLGDNVTVNYIGTFGSGAEAGRVFDTSIYAVGHDNASYPKALQYGRTGGPKNFTPLPVFVGPNAPSAGYTIGNLTFIGVVPGFWQGLVGLPVGETRVVDVPPALGYGPLNTACVATEPLVQHLPVVETLAPTAFTAAFPGDTATVGATFPDPHYHWPVTVLGSNATSVTLENLAHIGDNATPAGWPVVVTAVNSSVNGSGFITLQNQLSPSQAGHIEGFDFAGTGPCSSSSHGKFIVSAVNPVTGTYTENFNQEVQGETLIFTVTIVAFYSATPTA